MVLDTVFARFVEKSPASVMVRALLENVLQPGPLDELFERTATVQYTDRLLFSNVVEVMGLVVTGFFKSPHAHRSLKILAVHLICILNLATAQTL